MRFGARNVLRLRRPAGRVWGLQGRRAVRQGGWDSWARAGGADRGQSLLFFREASVPLLTPSRGPSGLQRMVSLLPRVS